MNLRLEMKANSKLKRLICTGIATLIIIGFILGAIYETARKVEAPEGDVGVSTTTCHLQINVTAPIINSWTFTIFQGPNHGTYVNDTQKDNRQWFNFTVNITDLSGWTDIRWINLSGWFDEGDDGRFLYYSAVDSQEDPYYCHNDSRPGRNKNFKIVMVNTTNDGDVFTMVWPEQDGDEVEINISSTPPYNCHTWNEIEDEYGTIITKNVTFLFWMGPQTRYAPGDATWDEVDINQARFANIAFNDAKSWNWNLTVTDKSSETYTDPRTNEPAPDNQAFQNGEFGLYQYCTISTSIGQNGVIYAAAPHGVWAQTPPFTLQESANDCYNLTINVTHDLWKWEGPGAWDYESDPLRNYSIGSSNIEFRASNWSNGAPYERVYSNWDEEIAVYNITRDGSIDIDYPTDYRNKTKDGGYVGVFKRMTSGAPGNGTYQREEQCVFLVFIPYGTPGGMYRTTIKITVDIPPREEW